MFCHDGEGIDFLEILTKLNHPLRVIKENIGK
jgi:hypothetical protein